MIRWIADARPVAGSQVTTTPHILAFPFAAATPMTFQGKNGKQYVAVVAASGGGGGRGGRGAQVGDQGLVVFALP